jgi:hypothetical protein
MNVIALRPAPFLTALSIPAAALLLTGCQARAADAPGLEKVPSLSVPRAITPPVIDGALEDSCWAQAQVIAGLVPSIEPTSVIPPSPTTVRVLWDAEFLYVGFECVSGGLFFTGKNKHDDKLHLEEVCEVFLDGFGDGRQYIEVQVNPAGVNLDAMHVLTRPPEYTKQMRFTEEFANKDRWLFKEWEMEGLRTAAKPTPSGWTAELAIPAAAVMKRKGSPVFFPTPVRANFIRYEHPVSKETGKREFVAQSWSTILLGCPHLSPGRMGFLNLREAVQ